jgi:hypothetical protein
MATDWYRWRHTLMEPIPPSNIRFSPHILLSMPTHLHEHPYAHLLQVTHHGFDREGHPIYWEKTGTIQSKFRELMTHFSTNELLQYHILSQDLFGCRFQYASTKFAKDIQKAVVVNDMSNLTMSLDMESIWYIKQVLSVDSNYYPERLHRLYLINCPWYFPAIFAMFKPFIDQRTRDKFHVLGSSYLNDLSEGIDLSEIPVEYGGTSTSLSWDINPKEASGGSVMQAEAFFKER